MNQRGSDPEEAVAGDALTHLTSLVDDAPETQRLLAQERVRVRLTDGMRQARQLAGLTQAELAARLGITQARVSRLESVHHDRRLDSVVGHLHAVGAELLLALRIGDEVIQIARPAGRLVIDVPDFLADLVDEEPLHR